jgi:hypothetical protein
MHQNYGVHYTDYQSTSLQCKYVTQMAKKKRVLIPAFLNDILKS